MKIVLFTPISKLSSIAGCSHLLVDELILQKNDVYIVSTDDNVGLSEQREYMNPVIAWRDGEKVLSQTFTADKIIFQMGNSYDFHTGSIYWMQRIKGILILHDINLTMAGLRWERGNKPQNSVVLENYPRNDENYWPMMEWLCNLSVGVLCHSNWSAEQVRKITSNPVFTSALIPNKKNILYSSEFQKLKLNRSSHFSGNTPINLIIFGDINANKLADQVIKILASSDLVVNKCVLRLVGYINPQLVIDLTRLSRILGVRLLIYGAVDDDELINQINDANIVLCFRKPVLEGSSGTLLEALLNKKVIFTMNDGHYSEIPDDAVIKITDLNKDLIKHLISFLENPTVYEETAIRGAQWAQETYRVDRYVENLKEFFVVVDKAAPFRNAKEQLASKTRFWNYGGHANLLLDTYVLNPLDIFE